MKLNGTTKGVPQGPAYARILAEFFLSTLLSDFIEEYKSRNDNATIRLFRYVDDIFIIYKNINDGDLFLDEINNLFLSVGLKLNTEKTFNFGLIKNLTDGVKESFFDDIYKNYIIQSLEDIDYLSEEDQFQIFELFDKYAKSNNEWNIKNANFLLGDHIDTELLEYYMSRNHYNILGSEIGRGSIFYKFYKIILKNPKHTINFFKNVDYLKIPAHSLNFKVFLVTLYYELNRVISLSDTIGNEFSDFINFLKKITTDDYEQRIINVILERLNNDY
jgi:DNA primase small subunit